MKMKNLYLLMLLGAIAFCDTSAHAYNWITHSQMVEAAAWSMQEVVASPFRWKVAPIGSNISDRDWQNFLQRLPLAASKLRTLHPSLNGPEISIPADIGLCGYNWQEDKTGADNIDLSQIAQIQIKDFPYYPKRPGKEHLCTLQYLSPSGPRGHILGKVLGWHAAMVDDHNNDTVLGWKPTNLVIIGEFKNYLSKIWDLAAPVLLLPVIAPFLCAWSWLSGDSCPVDKVIQEAINIATQANPVDLIDSVIPVEGKLTNDDLPLNAGISGLWHFMHVDSNINRFNEVRGMWYTGAGPGLTPGAVDVAIMVLGETGLTLNAEASDGVKQYGAYDIKKRWTPDWQSMNFGQLEYSSVQSMAEYGWENFRQAKHEASWLGWPLHALGDVAAPHHVVGTSAHGHRPFEDATEDIWSKMFPVNPANHNIISPGDLQLERILVEACHDWQELNRHKSVRRFVIDVGRRTRKLVADDGDWPYRDALSDRYLVDQDGASAAYYDDQARITPLIEHGIGAIVAFLTYAAQEIPHSPASVLKCKAGTRYEGGDNPGCRVPTPTAAPHQPAVPTPLRPNAQPARSCRSAAQVCTLNKKECCDDLKCFATDEPLPSTPCPPNQICIPIPSFVNRCCKPKDPCSKDSDCCDFSYLCNPTTTHCEYRPAPDIH